ncbi:MAG: hypothetical protein AAGB13_08115 [Cyanobacteria bacterium P01_F01_bin.33]
MNLLLGKPQRQWLVFFLLVSLLLPIVTAALLVAIGNASGCEMVGEKAQVCLVSGINIGQAIKSLVDLNWYIPVLAALEVPILVIGMFAGLLVLIYKSFRGRARTFMGCFSIWYFCFAPLIVGIMFVAYLAGQAQCSLNEGGVGSCYLFGVDMGSTFHAAATIPWLLFILLPLCSILSGVYIVISLTNK